MKPDNARIRSPLASAGLALGLLVCAAHAEAAMVSSKLQRLMPVEYSLEVDGQLAGTPAGVSGGSARGTVFETQVGPYAPAKKHLVAVSQQPMWIDVGMDMTVPFYDWVSETMGALSPAPRDVMVVANQQMGMLTARELGGAHMTEIVFPTLDASSKEPCHLSVAILPHTSSYVAAESAKSGGATAPTYKQWLCSNFRVDIGDLPTDRVSKIESFTWRQSVQTHVTGHMSQAPAKLEVPNLKLTISAADAGQWLDWYQSFVINGQSSDAHELAGSITFLAPDLTTELAAIELFNVGIISLDPVKHDANADGVARFEVELYVEEMYFYYKP